MPVIKDKATLNAKLGEWCLQYCPDYLKNITSKDFHVRLQNYIVIGDVFQAAKIVELDANTSGNEDLIFALSE